MDLVAGAATLVGRVREANEDAHLVSEGLVVVADGMGGHRAGEVASADTVATFESVVGLRRVEELVGAVHLANRRISERAAEDPDLRGMGTTVCAVGQVVGDTGEDLLAVLNVGDSRVYHFGLDGLTQLTDDHSLVETLVREGRLTPEEAAVHPQRNVLTRALGVEPIVQVDAWVVAPCDGDRFLLCSDGLFNEVSDDQIAELLRTATDPVAAALLLANRADDSGGRDNITAVVLDVSGAGRSPSPIADRVRRVPATAVADLSDLDSPALDTTASLPPVTAPLADDLGADASAAEVGAGPGDGVDDVGDDEDTIVAAAPATRQRSWRTVVFAVAVAVVVVVGIGSIVVGVVLRPTPTTTTTTTTSTSTTTTTTTVVPTTLVPTTAAPTPPPPASPVAPAPSTTRPR